MQYRQFSSTGLRVSNLVFSRGAVGGLLIDQDDDTKRQAIDRALAAGINWIDTAASYGPGRSEAALGELLAGRVDPPHISTKFTIDTGNLRDIRGQVEASLAASLDRLRRDSVPLPQLHNPIAATCDGQTIGVAEVLQAGGVLDACRRNGVAAMNIRVFSAGVIATDNRTGRERPLTPGDTVDSESAKAHALFNVLGERFGSRALTAIRFALAEQRLSCIVFGLAELDHLEDALVAEAMGALPMGALAEIDAIYQRGPSV